MIHLAPGPTFPSVRSNVWLPIIATPPADPIDVFYDLLLHDSRQRRPRLAVCKVLQAGAAMRAWGLANGEPFLHTDSQGRHANKIARSLGCNLPAAYSDDANYVESLCAGSPDVQVMFDSLANSPGHRAHLFGEVEFYRQQYHVGVGFAENPDAKFRWYFCVWIAACLD